MPFTVHLEFDDAKDLFDLMVRIATPDKRIGQVLTAVTDLKERMIVMSAEMDGLIAQARATRDALDSATLVIQGIATRIEAAGVDRAKLAEITADLRKDTDEVVQAIFTDGSGGGAPGPGGEMPPGDPPVT